MSNNKDAKTLCQFSLSCLKPKKQAEDRVGGYIIKEDNSFSSGDYTRQPKLMKTQTAFGTLFLLSLCISFLFFCAFSSLPFLLALLPFSISFLCHPLSLFSIFSFLPFLLLFSILTKNNYTVWCLNDTEL